MPMMLPDPRPSPENLALSRPMKAFIAMVAFGSAVFSVALYISIRQQQTSEVQSKRIDVLAHQAQWSLNHGEPNEALHALRELEQLEPRRPRLAYLLGRALLEVGESAQSLPVLRRATEESPGDADAWKARAVAEARAGDAVQSQRSLERAALVGPPAFDGGVERLRTAP